MQPVAIVAAGMSPFGRRKASYRDLIAEAGKELFRSTPNLTPGEIDGFLLATVMPERFVFQTHVAPLAAEVLGVKPSTLIGRVELLCASGSAALRLAYAAIIAGMAETVMVVGVEKMFMASPQEPFFHMLAAADREWDSIHGLTAPPFFALVAQEHMRKYGTTEEQLGMVAVKNRQHASLNQNAQFQQPITLAEVFNSKRICGPLKLFDCCSMSDGAAALLLTTVDKARLYTDQPVYIIGSGQAGAGNHSSSLSDYSTWSTLQLAAAKAYASAGITPPMVDVAEVHDCFTISEIIEYEELGWAPKGEGGNFIASGEAQLGGTVVVNPGGGLLGRGHPMGATGIAQGAELFWQLRGEAGARQAPGAQIGLSHNLSGLASEHTILVYSNSLP